MFPVEIGKQYDVHHARKGYFRIRVIGVDGHSIYGMITRGKARYISEADRGPGDRITLDRDFPGLVLTSVTEG